MNLKVVFHEHFAQILFRLKQGKSQEEDKERAKMLDEFWQRKKEAAANKARVSEALRGGGCGQVSPLKII